MVDGSSMNEDKDSPTPAEKRRRALLRWSITVAVAAILMIGVGALGPALTGQKKPEQPGATLSARDRSEQLRTQAEAAGAAGDVQTARVLAQRAVEADPSNPAARELVTRLTPGGGSSSAVTTTPSPSVPTTTAPPAASASPDTGYTAPIADLSSLIPTSFPHWSFDQSIVTEGEVSVSASPVSAKAAGGRLIWTVRDRESIAGAKSFVSKTTKVLYNKKAASVTVHGVTAYFGTDGERLATVTYRRGRFVFELIFPSALGREKGIGAATAFRDTPVR